jgi:hypothetical protein
MHKSVLDPTAARRRGRKTEPHEVDPMALGARQVAHLPLFEAFDGPSPADEMGPLKLEPTLIRA